MGYHFFCQAKPRIPKLGKLRDLTVSKSTPEICAHGRMAHALSPVTSPMETSLQEHASLIGCFQGFAVGIFRREICGVTYRLITWENDFPVQKGTKFRMVLGFWILKNTHISGLNIIPKYPKISITDSVTFDQSFTQR